MGKSIHSPATWLLPLVGGWRNIISFPVLFLAKLHVFLFFGAGLRVSGKDFFQLRKMVRIFITITECGSMGIVCALCAHLIGNALSVVAQVLCIMRSGAIEVSKRTGGILLHLEEEQALRRLYHPAREDRKEKGHPSTWTSVSGAKIGNSENGLELYTILGSPLVPFPHLHLLLRVQVYQSNWEVVAKYIVLQILLYRIVYSYHLAAYLIRFLKVQPVTSHALLIRLCVCVWIKHWTLAPPHLTPTCVHTHTPHAHMHTVLISWITT